MELIWIMLGSFLIGSVGALFIVWLRWIGTLPRFSSSIEIQSCEQEYEKVSKCITKKMEVSKNLDAPEITHSNNLRDDIWRQRTQSFVTSAILYTALGGASAVLFVGLETQNILDPTAITKILAAGALWTTFYSFLDVKKGISEVENIKDKVTQDATEVTESLRKKLAEESDKVLEYANLYNDVFEEYEKLTKKSEEPKHE